MKSTIYGVLFLMCMIFAVGSIDGPTGYESNNWLGCLGFAIAGIIFGLLTLTNQTENQ
tara:strand:+ start:176 stop:349 length:174 start_codon:yes stop_codon:yes gene_type:complete